MKTLLCLSAVAGLALGVPALGVVIPEVEANETKATATPALGLVSGDIVRGNSTGTGATAGSASRDFFRISTAANAAAIYRHRLALTTTGTAGHTGAIMGLTQSGAASDTTTVQTSVTTTTPARMSQWYGFGKGESLYYRVTGGSTTTANYDANYSFDVIVPKPAGTYNTGAITFTSDPTPVGSSVTDTEMYLYDSSFNLIGQNDDTSGAIFRSTISATLSPGFYYIALSDFNTAASNKNGAANNGGNTAFTDFSTSGNIMDFADSLVRNPTTALAAGSMNLRVNDGSTPVTPVLNDALGAFDVQWYVVEVVPAPGSLALLGLGGLVAGRRRR